MGCVWSGFDSRQPDKIVRLLTEAVYFLAVAQLKKSCGSPPDFLTRQPDKNTKAFDVARFIFYGIVALDRLMTAGPAQAG